MNLLKGEFMHQGSIVHVSTIEGELKACHSLDEMTDLLVSYVNIPLIEGNESWTLVMHITEDEAIRDILQKMVNETETRIKKERQRVKEFRLAIVNKDYDYINVVGTLDFIDDVVQTRLDDIVEKKLQPVKTLVIGMVDALEKFHWPYQSDVDGFSYATYSRLEALAWKTYQSLIRKAYRKGTALRAKHLKEQ